jgi:hypothetical protein
MKEKTKKQTIRESHTARTQGYSDEWSTYKWRKSHSMYTGLIWCNN